MNVGDERKAAFQVKIKEAYARLRESGGDLETINENFGLVKYGMVKEHGIEQSQVVSVVELDGQVLLIYLLKR